MLFRMIYDEKLAQAAYLIGCQRSGEAIIIDPERDIDRYVRLAEKEKVRIVAVAETHIHADYLSGARELAQRLDAMVYVSDEGDANWKYEWVRKRDGGIGGEYNHRLLKDGDTFRVGNIEFRAVHTPGHTPEHICFLVTDRGGGASEPMGIVTGDFLFVGDLGRPDLLETAAGVAGAKEPGARALFASLRRLEGMPEYMQVWPAHGAGSACGKALGAVPQSTIGYEKRFNPAIAAARDEAGFVRFILSDQPEPPLYFARMKHLNKVGPAILGGLPKPKALTADEAREINARASAVIDTRAWNLFRSGHLDGSLSIPLDSGFPTVAGSYIEPGTPIYLVIEESKIDEAVRDLVRVGEDTILGYITPSILEESFARGAKKATLAETDASAVKAARGTDTAYFLDVRRADEFREGHIPGARNMVHVRLPERLTELPRAKKIYVNCRSGMRSARAASYLKRAGFDVVNIAGGFQAYEQTGAEV
ncbi:MAG: rhodanese-like domain-containing protein, partial [Phycisphaerales bacterium]